MSVGCLIVVLSAASAIAGDVDDYVTAQMEKRHVPGLALAVVKDGQVVKSKGYGDANVELKAHATDETVFELGSITKQFTATAIMMLVEEGKVALDEPIATYLDNLPDSWKSVTVRQLLTHTSGIKSYTDGDVIDFLKLTRNEYKQEEIVKLVADRKPNFAPGEKWAYNNTGYYLLGMIIEKASGTSYADFLKTRIIDPLHMNSTRPSNPKSIVINRAAGYGEVFGALGNRDPITTSAAFSAGCLLSTVGDMAKWDAALREAKLLKPESFEAMYQPVALKSGGSFPYGFGWGVETRLGHRVISHGGGTGGFSSMFLRLPDDDLSVIVLTNLSGGAADAIAWGVARRYLPSLSIKNAEPKSDPDPTTTEHLKTVLLQLLAGEEVKEAFTDSFAKNLFASETKERTKKLAAEGELKSLEFLENQERGATRMIRYKATLGESPHLLTVTMDADGKIEGFQIQKDE